MGRLVYLKDWRQGKSIERRQHAHVGSLAMGCCRLSPARRLGSLAVRHIDDCPAASSLLPTTWMAKPKRVGLSDRTGGGETLHVTSLAG